MTGDAPRAPEPLTPPGCDLRDFPRMMIDITRLRASTFDATPDDAAWRAGLNLWFSAWHNDPAGSLDAGEADLCKAAGLGRDLRTWRKISEAALRGWVSCSDGRIYHPVVSELALEAWLEKLAQRLSSGAGNASRWKTAFDPKPVEDAIAEAARLLSALNPASKALPKTQRRLSRRSPDGTETASRRDAETIPSGSQETGTGILEVEDKSSPSDASASAAMEGGIEAGWREVRELYGSLVVRGRGSPMLAKSAWLALDPADRKALPAAIRKFADAKPWGSNGPPGLQRFIADDVWRDFAGATVTSIVWTGPAELRAAVVAECGEPFARSWLDPATWRESDRGSTLVAFTAGAAAKLRDVAALRHLAIQDPVLRNRA